MHKKRFLSISMNDLTPIELVKLADLMTLLFVTMIEHRACILRQLEADL